MLHEGVMRVIWSWLTAAALCSHVNGFLFATVLILMNSICTELSPSQRAAHDPYGCSMDAMSCPVYQVAHENWI